MIAQALYDGVRNLLVGKWMTTFAVLNFYMYPSILRVSFGIQKCVALDDGQLHPFADLDTNRDGKLSKREFKELNGGVMTKKLEGLWNGGSKIFKDFLSFCLYLFSYYHTAHTTLKFLCCDFCLG